MRTLECDCGKQLEVTSGNVGEWMEKGWNIAPTFDGRIIPLCGDCYLIVKGHAEAIYEVTKSKHVSLSHFLREDVATNTK